MLKRGFGTNLNFTVLARAPAEFLADNPEFNGSPMAEFIPGDGSIQMNIQELQTVVTHGLPNKIFVYNNDGCLSIKLTQKSYFYSKFTGSNPESGVRLPVLKKLAAPVNNSRRI